MNNGARTVLTMAVAGLLVLLLLAIFAGGMIGGMGQMMGGGMMGGGAMGVMLLVAAFLLFVWILGVVALGALGVWGFRRLSDRSSGQ